MDTSLEGKLKQWYFILKFTPRINHKYHDSQSVSDDLVASYVIYMLGTCAHRVKVKVRPQIK